MSEASDEHFLRAWAERADETAFRALVGRYAGFVHGAALRRVGDAGLAQEITQDVFARLSQNAARLAGHRALSGWLHRSAMLIALDRLRHRRRYEARVENFLQMNTPSADPLAEALPHLDEALDQLAAPDREVLVLHFFARLTFPEIAKRLGGSPDATRMRSNRALSAVSASLRKKGVTLSVTALATGLGSTFAQAAPASLVVVSAALAGAGKVSALTVIIHALQTMKTAKAAAVALLALVLATPLIFQQQQIAAAETRIAALQNSRAAGTVGNKANKLDELAAETKAKRGIDIKQLGEDTLGFAGVRRIRATVARLDANNLVGLIDTVRSSGLLPNQRENLLVQLMAELRKRDVGLFMEWSSKLTPPGLFHPATGDAFREWIEVDPEAAAEWATANHEICKELNLDAAKVGLLTAAGLLTSDPIRAYAMMEKMSAEQCASVLSELPNSVPEEQIKALSEWALTLADIKKRREILRYCLVRGGKATATKFEELEDRWARLIELNIGESETLWMGTRLVHYFGYFEEGITSAQVEWVEKHLPKAHLSYVKGALHSTYAPVEALTRLNKQLDEFPDDEVIAGYVESEDLNSILHDSDEDGLRGDTAFKLATRTIDPARRIDLLVQAWAALKKESPERAVAILNIPELSPSDRSLLVERIEKLPAKAR